MKTYVYVDGFNLYYGALKGTPYKWLDVVALCRSIFPTNNILRVRYFTAKVDPRPNDPDQPIRQLAYLRALATLPEIQIHFGTFLTKPVWLPTKVSIDAGKPSLVQVMRPEEKGSDVNLASYLLLDGFKGEYECAIVVSNDSDLLTPVTMVRKELNFAVGALLPRSKGSLELKREVTFWRDIRKHYLAACQLPAMHKDAIGEFHKPATW